jgi:hypothetical protein
MMWKRSTLAGLCALLMVVASACAGSGNSDGTRGSSNRLAQADLAATGVPTLYDAVQRLRPRWLDARSSRSFTAATEVGVVMNRTYLGSVEELRRMGIDVASSLEYMDGARAAGMFRLPGDRHFAGVIVIHTSGDG